VRYLFKESESETLLAKSFFFVDSTLGMILVVLLEYRMSPRCPSSVEDVSALSFYIIGCLRAVHIGGEDVSALSS
jgi:hypothetical protein